MRPESYRVTARQDSIIRAIIRNKQRGNDDHHHTDARQGTTPELLALDGLRRLFAVGQDAAPDFPAEETLFDFLQGYVGAVNGTTESLSENCGARFAQGMAEKQQNGSL